MVESIIGNSRGNLSDSELMDILAVLRLYFDLPNLPNSVAEQLITIMQKDKKNTAGNINMTLLNGIGNYSINNYVEREEIIQAIHQYNQLLV